MISLHQENMLFPALLTIPVIRNGDYNVRCPIGTGLYRMEGAELWNGLPEDEEEEDEEEENGGGEKTTQSAKPADPVDPTNCPHEYEVTLTVPASCTLPGSNTYVCKNRKPHISKTKRTENKYYPLNTECKNYIFY